MVYICIIIKKKIMFYSGFLNVDVKNDFKNNSKYVLIQFYS